MKQISLKVYVNYYIFFQTLMNPIRRFQHFSIASSADMESTVRFQQCKQINILWKSKVFVNDLVQAWPKWGPRAACGPSTYFCGPPIFLSFIKSQFYLNILYKFATKMTNVETKFKNFKKLRPAVKDDLRIWPASKKVWPPLI